MTKQELVRYIRAYAEVHYEQDCWDYVVEAWTDDDIAECIQNCRTLGGAIKRVKVLCFIGSPSKRCRLNFGPVIGQHFDTGHMNETQKSSKKYRTALAAHNAAYRAYDAMRTAYRLKQIDDAAFLRARAEYKEATRLYDLAYDEEQVRGGLHGDD